MPTFWSTIYQPGYLGKRRNEMMQQWDHEYGPGNWRLAWRIGDTFVDLLGACALYEDAYFHFMQGNPGATRQLVEEASNVYDDEESNVESGFDYAKQETARTHLQDIAIRRSLIRLGLWFKGDRLIRIRQEKGDHPLSMTLSPGRVPFHRPDLIVTPEIGGTWYHPGTVESFYQSNRFLQIRRSL